MWPKYAPSDLINITVDDNENVESIDYEKD